MILGWGGQPAGSLSCLSSFRKRCQQITGPLIAVGAILLHPRQKAGRAASLTSGDENDHREHHSRPRFAAFTPSQTTISVRPHAWPSYGELVKQATFGMASLAAAQSKSNP